MAEPLKSKDPSGYELTTETRRYRERTKVKGNLHLAIYGELTRVKPQRYKGRTKVERSESRIEIS